MSNKLEWQRFFFAVLLMASMVAPMRPQQSDLPALQMTTQERLETETWWPTMANIPLSHYAGSQACAGCHAQASATRKPSSMQRASIPAAHAAFLTAPQAFKAGSLSYSLQQQDGKLNYKVADGSGEQTQSLDWVIGAGELAHTFLYMQDGKWFQSELSFFSREGGLGLTPGFGAPPPQPLSAALGQALTPADARTCFGCHTVHATTSAGLNPLHAEAGVGCEACHGPALAHVQSMKSSGNASGTTANNAVFNPKHLSPSDSIDFCGACHRSFADANLSTGPSAGTAVIRFQPYRLEESRCWRATKDARLTCVACHNPHEPLNKSAISYDHNCLQCHAAPVAKQSVAEHKVLVCPKATTGCVTCHMPKLEVPEMHGHFTDHDIRIARAGEAFPR